MSKKLTVERLKQIKDFPIVYDEDCPKLTKEQRAEFKPANKEFYKLVPVKKTISIKIDVDILEVLKSAGKGYQTRINAILREAVFHGDF